MRSLAVIYGIIWAVFAAICGGLLVLSAFFLYLNPQVPDVSEIRDVKIRAPLRIYSSDNKLIQEFGERLLPVTFSDLPPLLVRAVLDIEDKRFFQHGGVDLITLLNASWRLIVNRGSIRSGASTIEMQLYKNITGKNEVKFIRKFKEILMAVKIEKELPKSETLALYLNIIPYGKHAYGIQAAANTYYGKNINELNLAQIAMLAGISKKPERGNPINGPEWALERRNLVLERMLDQGTISPIEYEAAIVQPITAQEHGRQIEVSAPYVGEMVRKRLLDEYGPEAYTMGLKVYTTLNSNLQNTAHASLRRKLDEYDIRHGYRGPEYQRLEGTDEFLAKKTATDQPQDRQSATEAGKAPDSEEVEEAKAAKAPAFPESWMDVLNKTPVVAGKHPAIVIDVGEQEISVLADDETIINIDWAGLDWAKPYLTVDSVGSPPKKASDIVDTGDLVRIALGKVEPNKQDKSDEKNKKESIDSQADADEKWVLSQVPEIQGAIIALDPETGAIQALVGGYDFYQKQFNHVTQARRQPGSVFKPFFYTGAIEGGLTAASIFNDAPIVLPGGDLEEIYRPTNAGNRFRGNVRLREALYRSINLVSLRVILDYGATRAVNFVERFGFDTSNFPRNVQLAFGGGTIALTPLEVATGYSAFANGGYKIDPYVMQAVESIQGEILFSATPPVVCRECEDETEADDYTLETPKAPRIIDERVAYIMDSILSDVIRRGTGTKVIKALKRGDLRGKTGTTNDADIWFSGYTRDLVATVWAGFDDNSPVGNHEWGATVPLETWVDFARAALPEESESTLLPQPNGLVTVRIDPETGFRAKPSSQNAIFEIFREEYAPAPLPEFSTKQEEVIGTIQVF